MGFFLAAGTVADYFAEASAVVVAGALVAYVGYRLGLVPIVGFLIAGVVIGPNALGLVQNQALVDAAAEVGVVLLLFTIGIEFSLEKLARIKALIFGGGGLQVGLATAVTAGLLALAGVAWPAAVFTGFLVALSSTAIVLKLLAGRRETATPAGQVSVGLLIFQDLAIIVMVLLVPMLAGDGGGAAGVGWALAKALGLIVAVLVVARRLMPMLLERVARTCSQELFLLTVIAICFGTAYATSLAGVSVSLGAFLAGLMVSESRFSEHAFAEILPLQILFSATFFVSVGMLLDIGFLVANLPLVLGLVAAVVLIKAATTAVSVRALGYGVPVAGASALVLAQVGEFSFVLERVGRDAGLYPAGIEGLGSQAFIAATVLLMIATPFLADAGLRLQRRRGAPASAPAGAAAPEDPVLVDHADHVVVAGYGPGARRLCAALRQAEVPAVVMTLSPERAREAERAGHAVVRGDAGRRHTLLHAGLERARLLVLPDAEPAEVHRIAAVARTFAPGVRLLARARRSADVPPLTDAGAEAVAVDEVEGLAHLLGETLRAADLTPDAAQYYADLLRAQAAPDAAAPPNGDRVRVYGADWCPLTGGFRAHLRRREVAFAYHNVEEDAAAEAAVRAMNDGALKFPMVVVGERAMKNPTVDELDAVLRAEGLLAAEATIPAPNP